MQKYKRIIINISLMIGIIISVVAFTPKDQEKVFIIKGSIAQWQSILNVLDLSAAEPTQRVAAKNFIINQLQSQLDSVKTKK